VESGRTVAIGGGLWRAGLETRDPARRRGWPFRGRRLRAELRCGAAELN